MYLKHSASRLSDTPAVKNKKQIGECPSIFTHQVWKILQARGTVVN